MHRKHSKMNVNAQESKGQDMNRPMSCRKSVVSCRSARVPNSIWRRGVDPGAKSGAVVGGSGGRIEANVPQSPDSHSFYSEGWAACGYGAGTLQWCIGPVASGQC